MSSSQYLILNKQPAKEAVYRGKYKTGGDEEHSKIIRLYIEDGLSVDRIGKKLGRSSRTPLDHVNKHNRAIRNSGFCTACRRVKSKYESEIAVRG